MRGVRVRPANHIHSQIAATLYHFPERIHIPQPPASVMKRNLGGIKGDAPAGAKACPVGMNAAEIVQPKGGIVVARVVLDEGELRPAHRAVVPSFGVRPGYFPRTAWPARGQQRSNGEGLQKVASINHGQSLLIFLNSCLLHYEIRLV